MPRTVNPEQLRTPNGTCSAGVSFNDPQAITNATTIQIKTNPFFPTSFMLVSSLLSWIESQLTMEHLPVLH